MKVRKGFVSNSSSSSFICEVCGNVEGGYDCSLADIEYVQCENGHIMCASHAVFTEEMVDKCVNANYDTMAKVYLDLDNEAENADGKKILKEDLTTIVSQKYLTARSDTFSDFGYDDGIPKEFCPICNLHSIDDSSLLSYVLIKHGSTREFVANKIRKLFTSRAEFDAAIAENSK